MCVYACICVFLCFPIRFERLVCLCACVLLRRFSHLLTNRRRVVGVARSAVLSEMDYMEMQLAQSDLHAVTYKLRRRIASRPLKRPLVPLVDMAQTTVSVACVLCSLRIICC